jgi:hypothetical protein
VIGSRGLAFVVAMAAAALPFRHWHRLPSSFPMVPAAFASGVLTFFLGAAVGIPGFLAHAGVTTSMANAAMIEAEMRQQATYNRGMVQGFAGLSIFTFLLLTPIGWLTMYLMGSGAVRMAAAWFDDPMGDPILTAIDGLAWGSVARQRTRRESETRATREGPETRDRVVSSAAAGIPDCDLVIVSSRRKPGWERGVVVFTPTSCYRLGEPIERTIAGHLRTLYPLAEHRDLEAVRKSVQYELPERAPS